MYSVTGSAALGKAGAASGQAQSVPEPRLVRAAHEFEAQMMKELLKPLTSDSGLMGDEDGGAGSSGALGEFAGEALGRALSERGGLGIATSIVHELSRPGNKPVTATVTKNLHDDTVMRTAE
jgi:Rod binding domain-containing protein